MMKYLLLYTTLLILSASTAFGAVRNTKLQAKVTSIGARSVKIKVMGTVFTADKKKLKKILKHHFKVGQTFYLNMDHPNMKAQIQRKEKYKRLSK